MAVAAYDSDLTSTNSGEIAVGNTGTDAGTWDESSNSAWDDAGPPDDETNFYINYTNCISAQFTKTGQGTIMYDDEGTTHAVDTDGAVLIWYFWASPASLSTYANGGLKILVGSGFGAFNAWDCGGSDFEPNPLGGWYCYAINPAIGSADDTVGTPGAAPYDVFGIATNATAQARGYPSAVNAIRVGRCTLEVTDGQAGSYGTFAGMESFDTSTNARYGLFQNIGGAYRWQGLMSLGVSATSVDFRDGNVSIAVANTPNVTANFNKIEIHNSSSNVEWDNVIMTSPGVSNTVAATASAGKFEVIDNATVAFNGCSFTDMDTFIFNGGTNDNTINTTTFRRCNTITQGGAIMDGCIFDDTDSTTAALVSTAATIGDLGSNSPNTFFGDGTTTPGHAVDMGSYTTTGTVNWYNILDNGVTNSAEWEGSTQAATAGPQGDANAAIKVNVTSGNALKISVASGATIPTVYNTGTGTVEITANEVTLTITVKDIDTGSVIEDAMVYVTNFGETATYINKVQTNASGQVSDTRSLSSAQTLSGVVRAATPAGNAYTKYYKSAPVAGTYSNTQDTDITIQLIPDE